MRKRKDRRRTWLPALAWLNLLALVLIWLAEQRVAERHWFTTGLTYMPQQGFALPCLFLLVWAAVRGHRTALLVSIASAAFFTITFLGFVWAPPAPPGHGAPVRVMTYNVHHAAAGAAGIAAAVRAEKPDILCLQEASAGLGQAEVVPRLAPLLPEYTFVRHEELAIGSRLPLIRREILPTLRDRRPALVAVYEVGGRRFTVVNVHFATAGGADSVITGRRGRRSYLRQTAAIRRRQTDALRRLESETRGPTLICGDFNTPPRGLVYRGLRGLFTDAFEAAGRGFGWTYPSRFPVLRIDYVWLREAVATRAWVPEVRASDHRPVVADVVLKANTG
jgi:vancomycin resistance protein VanJ